MNDKPTFEIVYDTELPGTPERVWNAATQDTPAWMFPTDQWPDVKTMNKDPLGLPDGGSGRLVQPVGTRAGTARR
ncbi:MAG: hypothetical protein JWO49_1658 [Arthrobacter sp.]|nr:hypothetical protein [Arthrobacter sp.]